jgi:hypothetical protein
VSNRFVLTIGLAVLASCAIGGYAVGAKPWSAERAQINERIGSETAFLDQVGKEQRRRDVLDQELRTLVDRTLAGDEQTADHRLRTRLSRIGEEVQLGNLTVGTGGQATARASPAAGRFLRSGTQKKLRDELDFMELTGVVSGEGTLSQALGLIHRLDAEPWIKRLTSVRLEPRENGMKFNVTVRLTTLYLPGREPRPVEPASYDSTSFGPYAALVERNPFRLPSVVPAAAVTAQPRPAAPPASFPWGQWALTGIAQGPDGPEVWLLNQSSGEARRLIVGEQLEEARLIAAAGERAEFQLGKERFAVMVGNHFDQRMPVQQ